MQQDNPELKLAADFIQFTGKNIFLTGKAGTGKTTFLRSLKEKSPKRMIVVAPTGVAAINAGGVTIHSFFQLPFGPYIPDYQKTSGDGFQVNRFSKEKINIIKSLDLLVIDEISMVRADLLDGVDAILRRFRDRYKPFGGAQLLMIGDLQQLSPVVKDDEWSLLLPHYDTPYFFSSKALKETDYVGIELKTVYRQGDETFISLLNKIRENRIDKNALALLNKRYIPEFFHQNKEGYITLTTHNYQAQQLNSVKLNQLNTPAHTFAAKIDGEFSEYSYPTDFQLMLKEGAQVMFVRNDISPEKLFYNGKIGKITAIRQDKIQVLCEGERDPILVEPVSWENIKYEINEETKEIRETKIGTFTQYPLKTAWAITIHKSQGLTFEHAIIDAKASFAHGQVYVALSRCKSLEGMVLTTPLSERSIINDQTVKQFTDGIEENFPSEEVFLHARLEYQFQLLLDLFDFLSIQKWIYQSLKLYNDNPGAIPSSAGNLLDKILTVFRTDVVSVAEKFKIQIQNLASTDIEKNSTLQERVKKGSIYFLEKLQSIVNDEIENLSIEIDNNQVKKSWNDYYQKLKLELEVKIACLIASLEGFMVKQYLSARAKAMLTEPKKPVKTKRDSSPKSTSPTPSSTSVSNIILHPELFNTLRKWRTEKAAEQGMPAYIILQQKTLYDLLEKLPVNYKELAEVNGFGQKKLKQYGKEVLEMIREFRLKKGMSVPMENKEIDF